MVKEPNPPSGTPKLRHSCHLAPPNEPPCACKTPSLPAAEPNGTGNLPHTDSNLITPSVWHWPALSAHIAAVRRWWLAGEGGVGVRTDVADLCGS